MLKGSTSAKFYYLMKSHYSQTAHPLRGLVRLFYYLMKSHYSQTIMGKLEVKNLVLLPYEITLFSNGGCLLLPSDFVLLPYEITLFSNLK